MKSVNVLITAAGSMKGPTLIKYLRSQKKYNIKIVATDASTLSSGLYMADIWHLVPPASDKKFIPTLIKLCRKEKIDVMLPLFSQELDAISKAQKRFNNIGTQVVISTNKTINTCQDKWQIYQLFKKHSIPTPPTILASDNYKKLTFPTILKPRFGSGSKNTHVLNTQNDCQNQDLTNQSVIQEFINGKEYTVDVFCNQNSNLIGSVVRTRDKIMDGKSIKGSVEHLPPISKDLANICKAAKIIGPANIQFIKTKAGKIFFIEINPRIAAGGLPLSIAAGLNTPELCISLGLGRKLPGKIKTAKNLYMLRYLDEVIINTNTNQIIQS